MTKREERKIERERKKGKRKRIKQGKKKNMQKENVKHELKPGMVGFEVHLKGKKVRTKLRHFKSERERKKEKERALIQTTAPTEDKGLFERPFMPRP